MIKTFFKKFTFKNYNWGKLGLELLVVFLGVTGGFVLNNWREEKQQLAVEHNYIEGFLNDVSQNIDELTRMSELDSIWLASANNNIFALKDNKLSADSADVMMKSIINFHKFEAHKGTFADITNSGNLNLIRNLELRSHIVDYQLAVGGVEFIDDHFYQYFNGYVVPFVFEKFDVLNGRILNEEIYGSEEFKNIFAGYYGMVQQRLDAYTDLLQTSHDFKIELDRENHD